MFAKYKHEGFTAVNKAIGDLALAAPVSDLGDSFQTKIAQATPARQAEFGAHLLSFLESAYGSTVPYTGPAMTPAHAGLEITIAQYQYFINSVVVPALQKVGVEADDISKCFAPTVLHKDFVKTTVTCK